MKLYKTLLHCLLITSAVGTYTAKATISNSKKSKMQAYEKNIQKSISKRRKNLQKNRTKMEKHLERITELTKKAAEIGQKLLSKDPENMVKAIKEGFQLLELNKKEKAAIQNFIKFLVANKSTIKKHKTKLQNIFATIEKNFAVIEKGNRSDGIRKYSVLQNKLKKLDTFIKNHFSNEQLPGTFTSNRLGITAWLAHPNYFSKYLSNIQAALDAV